MNKLKLYRLLNILMISLFVTAAVMPSERAAATVTPTVQPASAPQSPGVSGPYVSEPVTPGISPEVSTLPVAPAWQPGDSAYESAPRQNPLGQREPILPQAGFLDSLVQLTSQSVASAPAPMLNFAGIGAGGSVPPDTNGDVGPNHYVQMVNTSFAIYNKSGVLLAGPTAINALWTGQGNACEANNDGDPIVVYDSLADRWLLSQFAVPNPYYICIAISQTSNPMGAYYLYQFSMAEFPDYFKFGVWPDAYYMSSNESSAAAYAFDRNNMLAGAAATYQRFSNSGNFMLPSDIDGPTPPPAGSPNYFYTMMDSAFWGGANDRLEIWEFHVDWITPANSTFTLGDTLLVTPFDYTVCGFFVLACIAQPAPGQLIDAVSEWPMWRFAYRNFGTHQTLVGNFAVDVDNTNHAGIRWFELRNAGAGWGLFQEGTHAPDGHSRFMGSIAMDRDGNIALGYSVSSATLNPSIRYTTHLITDTLGTLQPEATLITGGGVQTGGFNRWGDYSAMSVDPADECTFWYTNEYYAVTSAAGWATRIGTFKIPSCGVVAPQSDLSVTKSDAPDPVFANQPFTYTIAIANGGPVTATNVVMTDTLPAGVTISAINGAPGLCQNTAGTVACAMGDLPSGGAISATLSVTTTLGGMITNSVIVAADQVDPNPANNTAATNTVVIALADLSLTSVVSPTTAFVGQTLMYTLTITNNGPSGASAITLNDTLPISVTYLSASPGCSEAGGLVSCSPGSLAAGDSLAITITVQITAAGSLDNQAVVTAGTMDPNLANNQSTAVVSVEWRLWLPIVIKQ